MPPQMIDNRSLLRCTLRKSADVFAKLVLYASYVVCGMTAFALAVYGAFALCLVLDEPVGAIINAVWNWTLPSQIFATVVGALAAIPWYVYVGITVVAAIFGYSLLWCIARELTEEDRYYGNCQFNHLAASMFGFAGIGGLVGVYVMYIITTNPTSSVVGIIFALPACLIGPCVQPHVSAYLHYRKRMKEERK